MYTNLDEFGGKFKEVINDSFVNAVNVFIASGYTSYDTISDFKETMETISSKGGQVKLLLGTAFYEGLNKSTLKILRDLSGKLESNDNGSGVYVSTDRKYHGKVFLFDYTKHKKCFVGSSNFSKSGLSENAECTVLIKDEKTQKNIVSFLEYLFGEDHSASILKADIVVPGSKDFKKKIALSPLDNLKKYKTSTIDKSKLDKIEISLDRIAGSEKANLNAYFGKGRWSRKTGLIKPRPWYEVEVIADRETNRLPLYPQGKFIAYTDDGYIIPMQTGGQNFKNIRSKGSLEILGAWIKGKLQRKGALIPLTPVTKETLEIYGNNALRLYKIKEKEYFMEF